MTLLAGSLFLSLTVNAQPIQPEVLFNFTQGPIGPLGNMVQGGDGGFYGTTYAGGSSGAGTVFKVATNGALTTLASFAGTNGNSPSGLTLGTDGNFYGTTSQGGIGGVGTVFKVTANGALTMLVSFVSSSDTNGAYPSGGLTLGNDGNFYGTTSQGGSSGGGTVFKVTTNGSLTTLVSFNGTNGASPRAAVTLGGDGSLYGTTESGGSGGPDGVQGDDQRHIDHARVIRHRQWEAAGGSPDAGDRRHFLWHDSIWRQQ